MFTAYKDAHVVVTGGANGIGKALALGFAKRGANVAVVDIHGDEAKAVAAEITAMGCKSIAIQADVSVLDECAKVYDTVMDAFGRCDVLVNDAGVSALSDVEHIPEKDLRWVFETNVYSHWFMMQKFLVESITMLNATAIFGAGLVLGFAGLFSSIRQAEVCANGIAGVGAGHNVFGATMVMAVFPELYAILALLVVILIGGTLPV